MGSSSPSSTSSSSSTSFTTTPPVERMVPLAGRTCAPPIVVAPHGHQRRAMCSAVRESFRSTSSM